MSSSAVHRLSNRPHVDQNQLSILALPPEILGEIFVHSLPEWPGPDPRNAPESLCRVCRLFREVAVSTPRLWNSLRVESFYLSATLDLEAYINFCQAMAPIWLSRARSLPLSLSFHDEWNKASLSSLETTLLPTIIALSEQWRSLAITGDFWGSLLESGSLDGKVPLLEVLSIDNFNDRPVILRDAPKLRIMSVDLYHPQIQVPWHQLTKLSARYIDIPSFLEILRNSTSLLQASFDFDDDEAVVLPVSTYQHANIQRLFLGVADYDERGIPMSILDCLKIPALNDLTVVLDWRKPVSVAVSPLLSFLSQPTLRLHTLALAYITAPMADLIECLKLAPFLTHFKFRSTYPTDFDILFIRLTRCADFLPRLEGLLVVFDRDETPPRLATSVAVEMLCWRWAAVGIAQLKSFRLVHGPNVSISPLFLNLLKSEPDFQRLEGEGMLLYVGRNVDNDLFWLFS
ncbi:hypothetical protein B0H16DRAFT_1882746 [Mycena metata]|uniref:F-box domain-containing protein n=1 Tax=Mycena metata TaxID=1033252 RepID=A0AAD7NLE4_9AGAR|nr:hypothetical protein B0H16DRAFT_1882746 [Mycena metata]